MYYYVILCARNQTSHDNAYITIQAEKSVRTRKVHEMAANEFRKRRGIGSNIHVQTATLLRAETREEVEEFMERFDAAVAELKENRSE